MFVQVNDGNAIAMSFARGDGRLFQEEICQRYPRKYKKQQIMYTGSIFFIYLYTYIIKYGNNI